MTLLLFAGALLFFLYPAITKKRISFIDLFILFCLYFDAMTVFAGGQQVNFAYYRNFLVLAFSLYYFIYHVKETSRYHKKIFNTAAFFLIVILLFPIIRGGGIDPAVRSFSANYVSIIILPISFHYYSKKGNIKNLLLSGYYFILFWALMVLVFTFFKIDVKGEHMGSDFFGGSIFYFGEMTRRGAMTYIAFALLLVPLILKYLNYGKKYIIIAGSIFLFAIIFIALKRFTFVVILFGLANYLIKSSLSLKLKLRIVFGGIAIIGGLLFITNIQEIVLQRYEDRGAGRKYGREAIEGDLRIYEPLYVLEYVFSGSAKEILIGRQFDREVDVISDRHTFIGRKIHNQYAQYILLYGLIGLTAYLFMFYVLYNITYKIKKELNKKNINVDEFWVVFQNLVIIFVIAGMVGGHIHVTFRSMVFLFSGGISGYFYKLLKERYSST